MAFFSFLRFRRKRALERKGPARRRAPQSDTSTLRERRRLRGAKMAGGLAIIFVWGCCVFSLIYQGEQMPAMPVVVGMNVPQDLYAQVDFQYVEFELTREARKLAAGEVADIYRLNTASHQESREHFRGLFKLVEEESGARETPGDGGEAALPQVVPEEAKTGDAAGELSRAQLSLLRTLFNSRSRQNLFLSILQETALQGIIPENSLKVKTEQIEFLDEHEQYQKREFHQLLTTRTAALQIMDRFCKYFQIERTAAHNELATEIFARLIRPSLIYDDILTRNARAKAAAAVAEITRSVKKNTLILKKEKGRRVTAKDKHQLQAHSRAVAGTRRGIELLRQIASPCGWSLLITIVAAFFFAALSPTVFRKQANVYLLGLLVGINILLVWGVSQFFLNVFPFSPLLLYPALPLAFAAILLALLLDVRVGMSAGILMALLISLQGGNPIHIFVLGLVASVVGGLSVRAVRTRVQIFRAVLCLPGMVFLVEGIYLLLHGARWESYLLVLGIASASCVVMVIVINLALPFLEFFFGITTNISLLELSDLNHPLLKRLSLEAPGTYNHTIMVATLAEAAAEAVGANPLLTRVASYFHDLGKLANPSYFIENSFGEDMHQDLSPKMSSLIILNHVKEGLAMADRNKLKPPIREAIASHHGTSLIYFFYHLAKKKHKLEAGGGEHEFRYSGPKPKSPEASIISLADACEAASRSLEKPTPPKIDAMVDEICQNKIADGQLNDSELSMEKIHLARETMKKTLRSMLHGRVAYPKEEETAEVRAQEKPAEQAKTGTEEAGTAAKPTTSQPKTKEHDKPEHNLDEPSAKIPVADEEKTAPDHRPGRETQPPRSPSAPRR